MTLIKAGSRRRPSRRVTAFLLVACLAGCAPKIPLRSPPSLSASEIAAVVASPDRSAADQRNDARRKPAQLLAFFGVRPGMQALDVSAGGGYTTELLARAIGPAGTVYGQSQPQDPAQAPRSPQQPEGSSPAAAPPAMAPPAMAPPAATPPADTQRPAPRGSAAALAERQRRLREAGTASARIVPVAQRFDDPVPAEVADGQLDLVTLMFNYHDFGFLGVDRQRLNRAIFRALKPGGVYVVADHAGRPGTGISESGTLHRIEEAFLRSEVEAAGFRVAAEADFLRNPNDPRDRNTPEPPQPKDDFVISFVKP